MKENTTRFLTKKNIMTLEVLLLAVAQKFETLLDGVGTRQKGGAEEGERAV